MKKKTKIRLINGAILLCLLAGAASGSVLVFRGNGKKANQKQLDSLSEIVEKYETVFSKSDSADSPGPQEQGDDPPNQNETGIPASWPLSGEERRGWITERESRLEGYRELKDRNSDMSGWVTVPGTRIDYPVMQSVSSPNYYLRHDFEKKKSSYGIPYAAEHCDLENGCANVVIYGHHMRNGTMFADLMKYTDESFSTRTCGLTPWKKRESTRF